MATQAHAISNMYSMKANGTELEHTNNNNSVPDISISAADTDIDIVGGLDVGLVEGTDDLKLPATASVDTSLQTQTQTNQDAVMMEKERIFMGEINRQIDQYNVENKQQDNASTSCLPQKRASSSLTETTKRRKESTGMFQKDASLFSLISNKSTLFIALLFSIEFIFV